MLTPTPTHQLTYFENPKNILSLKALAKQRFAPRLVYPSPSEVLEDRNISTQPLSCSNSTLRMTGPSFLGDSVGNNFNLKPKILKRNALLRTRIPPNEMTRVKRQTSRARERTEYINYKMRNTSTKFATRNYSKELEQKK